uniref:Uncharacterized protein n=1 Tax=Arundo donax TaxID=35708 RepID=A0A0A9GSN1_ARUDO
MYHSRRSSSSLCDPPLLELYVLLVDGAFSAALFIGGLHPSTLLRRREDVLLLELPCRRI